MSAEVPISEISPYECFVRNIVFDEMIREGRTWKLVRGGAFNTDSECDLSLATALTREPSFLPNQDGAKMLVLNCSAGYAGVAALQLNYPQVVFVGALEGQLTNLWKSVYLNAPDNMSSARCFCTDGLNWTALDESVPNAIWAAGPYETVLLVQNEVASAEWDKLYCILERHLTSTGAALVAVQSGAERAGVSASAKAALFEHTAVALPHAQEAGAGTTTVVRVAKRAIMQH